MPTARSLVCLDYKHTTKEKQQKLKKHMKIPQPAKNAGVKLFKNYAQSKNENKKNATTQSNKLN